MAHQVGVYEKYIKRAMDVLLSLGALVVLSPVLLIVAVLVRTKLGSPVLFRQERPGKDGKIFALYKFRTMTDARDQDGNLLPDEVRLTRFGKLLRSTSLDELPELYNILRGDMSLVGPRPLLVEYLPYYSQEENRRHNVRPGLTGLAQVNGRNSLGWADRFAMDVQYVDRISFTLDVSIMLQTAEKILKRSDIAENTQVVEGNFAQIRKQEMDANATLLGEIK